MSVASGTPSVSGIEDSLLNAAYVARTNPGSLYTGTIAAVVIVVLWVYYAALIFVLGGEVAQVHELRRIRRMQREQLE